MAIRVLFIVAARETQGDQTARHQDCGEGLGDDGGRAWHKQVVRGQPA